MICLPNILILLKKLKPVLFFLKKDISHLLKKDAQREREMPRFGIEEKAGLAPV